MKKPSYFFYHHCQIKYNKNWKKNLPNTSTNSMHTMQAYEHWIAVMSRSRLGLNVAIYVTQSVRDVISLYLSYINCALLLSAKSNFFVFLHKYGKLLLDSSFSSRLPSSPISFRVTSMLIWTEKCGVRGKTFPMLISYLVNSPFLAICFCFVQFETYSAYVSANLYMCSALCVYVLPI